MSFMPPPGYQPIYNPMIPYSGPIYGGLRSGMSLYFQGRVESHTNRFFVNLQCGESEDSDIALHFNPRFDGWDKVVFNSRQHGDWDDEEHTRDMPFVLGEGFELVIMVTHEGYQFKVNGHEFYSIGHRIAPERVSFIRIDGDVAITTINIIGGGGPPMGGNLGSYPDHGGYPAGQGGYPGSHLPGMGGQPEYNPPIPFSTMIPGGMSAKRTIIIRGMVLPGGDSVTFNLSTSRSRDIAFHMNPRVREGVVVRNSQIEQNWGAEERELSYNPFAEGQYFDMSIRCGNQRYKVFINGQPLLEFYHRIPFDQVDMLEIAGDVQISYVQF